MPLTVTAGRAPHRCRAASEEILGPFLDEGDILGHEPMGVVEEVGPAVAAVRPGDQVVVPFNVSCGDCFMCGQGLQSQCETTQVREHGTGASLFGWVCDPSATCARVCTRIARHRGVETVSGIDLVPEPWNGPPGTTSTRSAPVCT